MVTGEDGVAAAVRRRAEQWVPRGRDPELVELVGLLRTASARVLAGSERVLAGHGLTRGQFDVLAALYRAGDGASLTQAELADGMLLTSAGMKKRVDALVGAGLIARTADPDDQRKQRLALTAAGLATTTGLLDEFFEAERAVVDRLGASDRDRLRTLLQRMLA